MIGRGYPKRHDGPTFATGVILYGGISNLYSRTARLCRNYEMPGLCGSLLRSAHRHAATVVSGRAGLTTRQLVVAQADHTNVSACAPARTLAPMARVKHMTAERAASAQPTFVARGNHVENAVVRFHRVREDVKQEEFKLGRRPNTEHHGVVCSVTQF